MAAATVGGAFLCAFLDVVFDRLASPEVANLIRGKKLDRKLLQRLETTLKVVRAVLDDAEKKQITDSNVRSWIDDLKDAVYFADDLLDEISSRAATRKEENVSNLFSRLNIFNVQDREMVRMASELEDVVDRLECILQLKNSLDLKVDNAMGNNLSYRTRSTSLEDEFQIYGREKDKMAVMNLLTDDKGDAGVSVIPIVGMGGVGKTTFARMIYNDGDLGKVFDYKAWVCVSDDFDILKVTRTIVKAMVLIHSEADDLDTLHRCLYAKLKGKRFFIVLDDVWIQDYSEWRQLIKPFQHGIGGSKILITTRNDKVADVAQTCQAYHLNQLSNEDCWLVFANHACLSFESAENTMAFEQIGKDIVRKCKGLPLAAQSLGAMLRTKHDIKYWKKILNSDIWDLPECESEIIPALRVSYHYLPPHLKRCFVYCSLYPKNYKFQKNELILLWMAEDLLSPFKKGSTLEEVGDEYFDDLASRSFFQHSSSDRRGRQCIVMHDLMHDLATSLGREFYFRAEQLGRETKMSSKTRHLSFSKFNDPIIENFEVFNRLKFLRTFLPVDCYNGSLDNESAANILLKIKNLRVLSFPRYTNLSILPYSIGNLIHLRYLNLSRLRIKILPESLGNLYNLQTLLLERCFELTMLPDSLQNLVNLRNLDIRFTHFEEMPKGMGKLNQLQSLCYFIVGKHEDNGIKELGNLSNLCGSLSIRKLENITNSSQAMGARMMDKKYLNRLSLEWSLKDDCVDSQIVVDIFCKLQPYQDLEFLHINGYSGTKFPDWIGYSSFHNMKDLKLSSCKNCCMLPSLGQLPYLRSLQISGLNGLEKIDVSFYKNDDSSSMMPFPSIQSLSFRDMPNWEVWTPFRSDAFPLLQELEIKNCPKLKGGCMLPSFGQLPSLKSLKIEGLKELEKIDVNFYKNGDSSSVIPFPSLHTLVFCGMGNWEVWTPFGSDAFPLLELLHITHCPKLKGDLPRYLPSLKELKIVNCKQIASSLPSASTICQLDNIESNKLALQKLPPSIKSITIERSPVLVGSMFEILADTQPTCLRSLVLIDHSTLTSPSRESISSCKEFLILSSELRSKFRDSLIVVVVSDLLTSLPLDTFPNPKCLVIRHSDNLKSLYVSGSHSLHNLAYLYIRGCRSLDSFPKEGLPAPNLTQFYIIHCDKLKSLPHQMNALLPKLEELVISQCPEIEPFQEGSMPPNMRKLVIQNCEKLVGSLTWPKEGLLPPSLTSLGLYGISSLETLDCKGLLHLTSLQELRIQSCPKLENMEGERLPASLMEFDLFFCPLLKERCRTKHPQIWPKISHIPKIYGTPE